jgi:CubicO group peptidase (beta-lactamase class C family)
LEKEFMLRLLTQIFSIAPFIMAAAPAEPCHHASEQDQLAERLDSLIARMEKERVTNNIPGFGLAIVKDGEVVLARGFGIADVESQRPVEADTLFPIGSSTKAFTATLIGMLQDEGTMNFDDPVVDYIPYFDLPIEGHDEKGDAVVTLRDLMSHRTGFTRMSMLWTSGEVPAESILKAAVRAEPWAGFREEFLYNNVMFLAAGVATSTATTTEWSELIETRIFDPLQMNSSNLSIEVAQADERLALGYSWNSDTEDFERKIMIDLHNIGPAGGINSNVLDMAKWLQFQMGYGQVDGTQLISKEALEDTWTANIKMGSTTGYGMGWMLRKRKEGRVIEHGGNIDGFAATCAFMPEAGVGFVLLSNISMSGLQQAALPIVFDAMLSDLPDETAEAEQNFDEYAGNYLANFGPFKDAGFEVLVQNDNLAVDVPGQMIFELFLPAEDGKRSFRITDEVAVSFHRNDDGDVASMKLYQSGMTFELPREGYEVAAEIPLEQLKQFLGKYRDDKLDDNIEVVIQNNRLAVDVPGEMVFELKLPDEEGKRFCHVTDKLAVRFNKDDLGKIASFTIFERESQREVVRIASASATQESGMSPTEELMALIGLSDRGALLATHGTLRTQGSMHILQCGLEGKYTFEARQSPTAYRFDADFGEFGSIHFGADGSTAWSHTDARGHSDLAGEQRRQMLQSHPSTMYGDWKQTFDSIEVKSTSEREGHEVIVADLSSEGLPGRTVSVDRATGRLLHMKYLYVEGQLKMPVETEFSDFREVEGVMVAFRTQESNPATGRSVQQADTIELGVDLAGDFWLWADAAD